MKFTYINVLNKDLRIVVNAISEDRAKNLLESIVINPKYWAIEQHKSTELN